MPKRSVADTATTHQAILKHASQTFREHGGSVGINDLMNTLGLTRGGFYRHFDSKDHLFIEAAALGLDEMAQRLTEAASTAEPGRQLEAIITTYLSPEHLHHPEAWCVLAVLAPEIARLPLAVREQLDAAMQRYIGALSPYMPGDTAQERSAQFMLLFSGMAGAISMLRVLGDDETRRQMLNVTRTHYLQWFTRVPEHTSSTQS
ncbi:TetR/AcrR family transcriptional regulator [Deinococcus ruber]|uniref:TetR family transcriptional regulator n=1 Tax=Deinococcus ruber TaxID=1848197 RepID=A0A918F9M3_9DEIO|nr:TetR/AcrR family transcriptional regulator [Deinococcus ruber]GGR22141.1 TetR family transcriptional regulator [Deinococcus ruber]